MTRHPFDCIRVPALPPRPRQTAVTSVIDKGLGAGEARELVATAGEWIDVVKLGWASARLTAAEVLHAKIAAYAVAGVRVCTGGTFLEIAYAQGAVDGFFEACRGLGIAMVEVSNGIHPMSDDEKLALIARARDAGFAVWSEVGKKDPAEDARISFDERIRAVERELDAGAEKVVLEARESGTMGIYSAAGEPADELLRRVVDRVGTDRLVFEAPQKSQQVWMIRHFGAHVNLGNVPPTEALGLATLRTGLRGDTFADVHLSGVDVYIDVGVDGALAARKRGGVVVVIDALRFSATVVTALAAGMARVKVVARAEDCVGEVTAGERGGKKLANCMHGNSPTELLRYDYAGKELVLTSTNGAEVLVSATDESTTILVGTTLNARAIARAALALARERDVPITLLEAGRNTVRAIEDGLAAAEILHAMGPVRLHGEAPPSARALEPAFFAGESGRNLVALGYTDDVHFCAQLDVYDVVPVATGGVVVARDIAPAADSKP